MCEKLESSFLAAILDAILDFGMMNPHPNLPPMPKSLPIEWSLTSIYQTFYVEGVERKLFFAFLASALQ